MEGLHNYTKNEKVTNTKRQFIAALFSIAKTWKQPKCPSTEEWIKKMWHIYTMEYYSAIKRNEILAFFSNMDGPRNYHAK